MSKNAGWILHGGVHSVHIGVQSVVTLTHRGRPEPENGTPVNMGNRLHRDNGEGVAATPLPYPLAARKNLIITHFSPESDEGGSAVIFFLPPTLNFGPWT